MSIVALYELQERLNATAIAGVNMINEDFRLQRSIEQFKEVSGSSPVFQKIAQQLAPLVQTDVVNKEIVLMEALALIDAVLYTQGVVPVNGELESIQPAGFPYYPCRYSELQTLVQSLTDKGSGRYEVVHTAFETKSPALHDYRLRNKLVAALGDSYSEMAELVKDILVAEGESVIPLLKQDLDPKGKKEMARRVEVIEQIAGERENEYYLSLLEGSSSTVKEAAIYALRHDQSNADTLIHLADTEKGDKKNTAYTALKEMQSQQTIDYWIKAIEQNPVAVQNFLDQYTNDEISDAIARKLEQLVMPILQSERNVLEQEEVTALSALINMLDNKCSPTLVDLYGRLASYQKDLSKWKSKQASTSFGFGEYDNNLLEVVNSKLIASMIRGSNKAVFDAADLLYRQHEQVFLRSGFAAALLTRSQVSVFDEFAPKLHNQALCEQLVACLSQVDYDDELQGYYLSNISPKYRSYYYSSSHRVLAEPLDNRWFECLTDPKVYQNGKFKRLEQFANAIDSVHTSDKSMAAYDSMLIGLINPQNKASSSILYAYFLNASEELYTSIHLQALARLGHTEFEDLLKNLFRKSIPNTYQLGILFKDLNQSREQQIQLLEWLRADIVQNQRKSRYLNETRLQARIDSLKQGEEERYW